MPQNGAQVRVREPRCCSAYSRSGVVLFERQKREGACPRAISHRRTPQCSLSPTGRLVPLTSTRSQRDRDVHCCPTACGACISWGQSSNVPVACRCTHVHKLQHDTIITVRGGIMRAEVPAHTNITAQGARWCQGRCHKSQHAVAHRGGMTVGTFGAWAQG